MVNSDVGYSAEEVTQSHIEVILLLKRRKLVNFERQSFDEAPPQIWSGDVVGLFQ